MSLQEVVQVVVAQLGSNNREIKEVARWTIWLAYYSGCRHNKC